MLDNGKDGRGEMAIGAFDQEVIGARGRMTTGRAVRPDLGGVVTCERCGCRLTTESGGTWVHFAGRPGHDARGCRVECVELPHQLGSANLA